MLTKIFKNHEGFSLVQIMIAMGLLGVISVGIMQVMKTGTKTQTTLETSFELTQALSFIERTLASPGACEATVKDKNLGDTLTAINDYDSDGETVKAIYTINQEIGKIKILSIKIDTAMNTTSDGGLTNIIIEFDKGNSGKRDMFGGKTFTKKIAIFADNCDRDLIVNQASKGNLQTTCNSYGGKIKDYEQDTDGTWFGTCQYCNSPRIAISNCERASF